MSDLLPLLRAALEGTYAVERQLGQGGMAVVFLARDLRHGRQVAIKVFLPEIAAAFGKGRFLQEIRTAANLSHPNILALHDSGEGDGLLYYVMPYVEGESLADRLAREGQLPIEQALAITRQVAAALQHAHGHGIVHRDIKPGNILLSGDNAFVADFGIAHALEQTGEEKLTSTGIALGTPAYMSPEQISGSRHLDRRADIYSLGCVLFEMLVGEPPFTGPSAQAVLARHSIERIPSPRAVRDTIPPALEAAIYRAMAKTPADRFATADDFAAALAPDRLSQAIPILPPARARRGWLIAAGALTLAAAAVVAAIRPWSLTRRESGATLGPDLVAVLPFRAGGAADSALTNLAARMADLVARRLPGDGGPRAIAAATMRAALQKIAPVGEPFLSEETARRVARSAGAGLLLLGDVTRTGDRVTLNATLARTTTGTVVWRAENISGPPDSLPSFLDRFVAQLLAGSAGEQEERRDLIATLPLPELRDYLAARHAFFRGQFGAAIRRYAEALRSDSTFFPAALGLASAGTFVAGTEKGRGIRLARAQQHRLGQQDRLYLEALAGPRFPDEPTIPEFIKGWEEAAREGPIATNSTDSVPVPAEIWYHLGEALFHHGPWTGAPDVLRRAAADFRRALELEPEFVPALGHLLDLAAIAGDTAAVRELGPRYFAIDSTGDLAEYYRWRVAVLLGDQRELRLIRARIDSLGRTPLERIVNVAQLDGVALQDAVRAAAALWSRSGASGSARWAFIKLREIALNRGRPAEAAAVTVRWTANQPMRARDRLSEVVDAIYWEADTAFAARLVRERAPQAEARLTSRLEASDSVYYDICAVNLWRVNRDELAHVRSGIAGLRRVPNPLGQAQTAYIGVCADILDARLADAQGRADARDRLERLDSLARTAPPTITWILAAANLTAAHLWEKQGDLERALAATRRRLYITDIGEPRVLVAQSTFLREEGRLAALTGDRESAIRAYRKYLALRADAEPIRAPEVARVRAALDSLEKNPPRK